MAERPTMIRNFKTGWHQADVEGDTGNRVKRGLEAVLDAERPQGKPTGADTGCPHDAWEIDTEGNPTRCADCGDDLAEEPEQRATAEERYPMPERDDYETQTDWVTAVVMVQGKRHGWIDHGAALAEQGTEEGEIEYRVLDAEGVFWAGSTSLDEARHYLAQEPGGRIERAVWVPVDQPASGVETRTPNRPNGSRDVDG